MNNEREPGLQALAVQARARAAELDRQAKELDRLAGDGNWRQRARIRAAVDRLRHQAGRYLVLAQGFEARMTTDA